MPDDQKSTDIDAWRGFLARFGIPFVETTPFEGIATNSGELAVTVLEIETKSAPKVVGYRGFAVNIEFGADGRFLRFGIWE